MNDTIEVNERPLSPEERDRDYVNIKGAAQIFGDVSEKTARRYLSTDHGVIVNSIEKIVNGGVGKLYRKTDVIAVAEALNVIPSVVEYKPVTVRLSESTPRLPTEAVTEGISLSDQDCLRVATGIQNTTVFKRYRNLFFGTQIFQVLVSILFLIGVWLLRQDFHRQSRQIASLKSYIAHKKI